MKRFNKENQCNNIVPHEENSYTFPKRINIHIFGKRNASPHLGLKVYYLLVINLPFGSPTIPFSNSNTTFPRKIVFVTRQLIILPS